MPRDHHVLPGMPWSTLAVISTGGVIGALVRYALIVAFPEPAGAFVWPVFWINVTGSLLIGLVIVCCTQLRGAHRLLRPFLATGVLGGFTTFSTYITGVQHELAAGSPRTAVAYAGLTAVAALAAAWVGLRLGLAATGGINRMIPNARVVPQDDLTPSPDEAPSAETSGAEAEVA